MIEANHPRLSVVRQCELVSIARSSHYYAGKGESALNLKLMRLIDEQFSDHAVVRVATDGALPAATGLRCRPQTDSSIDAADGSGSHLPEAENVDAPSSASDRGGPHPLDSRSKL